MMMVMIMNNQPNKTIFQQREENLMKWDTFWKANTHRFVKDYLDIDLHLFQKITIYIMNYSPMFVMIAPRGIGKSWITAVYAVTRCILYPGTKVVIASGVKNQARMIISEKIVALYHVSHGLRNEIGSARNIKTGVNDAEVVFKNGSKISIIASSDYSRGVRGNVIIMDEFRMIEQDIVNTVIKPIGNVPRIPRFKSRYPNKYKDYSEDNIEIKISSAWYKSDWSYAEYKNVFLKMLKNPGRYFALAFSYQLSLMHGLLEQKDVTDIMTDPAFDKYSFAMEYEGQFVGENENAFFNLEAMINSRTVEKVFIQPDSFEYLENKKLSRPKDLSNLKMVEGEIRIISLDVALMGDGNKHNNDTSVMFGMRLLPDKGGGYKRQVVFIESIGTAIKDKDLAVKFKRLFYDFEASYAVLDAMGVGLGVYDRLAEETYDTERDMEYPSWASYNDAVMADRAPSNSVNVLYTIKASASLNTMIATELKSAFLSGKLQLPISEVVKREDLVQNASLKFLTLPQEKQHKRLASFQQATALVNELNALEWRYQGNNIKITEPSDGTKDRYSSLAYCNHVANEIEVLNKQKSSNEDFEEFMFTGFEW